MATKAVREARARVAEIEAERAALQSKIDNLAELRAPASAAIDKQRARLAKATILVKTSNTIDVGSLADYGVEARNVEPSAVRGKRLPEALAGGAIKITGGAGGPWASTTAKGLAARVRTPSPANVAAIKAAQRAVARAEATARRRRDELRDAIEASFEDAPKWTTDQLATALVPLAKAQVAYAALPRGSSMDTYTLQRFTEEPYGSLTIARQHLAFAESGDAGECPCRSCISDRTRAEQQREQRARIDALPERVRATCKDHGSRLMRVEIVDDWYESKRGPLVRAWCPIDYMSFVHGERTAKLRAPKPIRAKRPAKGLDWLCPNPSCGEAGPFEPEDGEVVCESCEYAWGADTVKTVRRDAAA